MSNHSKGFPDLPPIWLLGTLVCVWILGRGPGPSLGAAGEWIGGALILAALVVIVWAAIWLRRKRTPIEPHHTPVSLVVEGPYRRSRNPIYLALIVIALGAALRQDSLLALLPVPALWWVLDRRFAAPEEAALREAFGVAADLFIDGVPRWF